MDEFDLEEAGDARVLIGIGSQDIDAHECVGASNNSVGYDSFTGQCTSSHRSNANTNGKTLQAGDSFGLCVTYFGQSQSTVLFFYNNEPIATRLTKRCPIVIPFRFS